jgi:hypothetical protein
MDWGITEQALNGQAPATAFEHGRTGPVPVQLRIGGTVHGGRARTQVVRPVRC